MDSEGRKNDINDIEKDGTVEKTKGKNCIFIHKIKPTLGSLIIWV